MARLGKYAVWNALSHYGDQRCRCCGADQVSVLAVVPDVPHPTAKAWYTHYKETGQYPTGYHVLCANCEASRRVDGGGTGCRIHHQATNLPPGLTRTQGAIIPPADQNRAVFLHPGDHRLVRGNPGSSTTHWITHDGDEVANVEWYALVEGLER